MSNKILATMLSAIVLSSGSGFLLNVPVLAMDPQIKQIWTKDSLESIVWGVEDYPENAESVKKMIEFAVRKGYTRLAKGLISSAKFSCLEQQDLYIDLFLKEAASSNNIGLVAFVLGTRHISVERLEAVLKELEFSKCWNVCSEVISRRKSELQSVNTALEISLNGIYENEEIVDENEYRSLIFGFLSNGGSLKDKICANGKKTVAEYVQAYNGGVLLSVLESNFSEWKDVCVPVVLSQEEKLVRAVSEEIPDFVPTMTVDEFNEKISKIDKDEVLRAFFGAVGFDGNPSNVDDLNFVYYCIKEGKVDVNAVDENSLTGSAVALEYAIMNGDDLLADLLVRLGADFTMDTQLLDSFFVTACENGLPKTVKRMMNKAYPKGESLTKEKMIEFVRSVNHMEEHFSTHHGECVNPWVFFCDRRKEISDFVERDVSDFVNVISAAVEGIGNSYNEDDSKILLSCVRAIEKFKNSGHSLDEKIFSSRNGVTVSAFQYSLDSRAHDICRLLCNSGASVKSDSYDWTVFYENMKKANFNIHFKIPRNLVAVKYVALSKIFSVISYVLAGDGTASEAYDTCKEIEMCTDVVDSIGNKTLDYTAAVLEMISELTGESIIKPTEELRYIINIGNGYVTKNLKGFFEMLFPGILFN